MEEGNSFAGRRRRRHAAPSVHGRVSANHEQVLMRHLLTINEDKRADEVGESDAVSNQNWSHGLSTATVIAMLMIVAAMVAVSVVLLVYRRSKTAHPSNC